MATNKEAKVKFTAETSEFSKGISNINKSLGNLKSDLKLVNTEIKANGASFDALSSKQKTLQGIVSDLSSKLELQGNKLEAAKRLFGENSDEVNKLYRGYNNIQGELVKFTSELKDTENALEKMGNEAEESSRDIKKLDDSMDDVEGSSGGLKGVLEGLSGGFDMGSMSAVGLGTALGNLASEAIGACIDAIKEFAQYLWELPEATREFEMNMSKLAGSTKQYGYDTEDTNEKVKELYGYFEDEQVAVNAITNLQGMGLSQKELSKTTNAAIAVWSAYGDSIPIESLTESINETSQVGKVTGSLADALNWAGISEDKFNEKLAKCKTTQERAKLVTDTLNDAYGESKKVYDEATKGSRKLSESQFELMTVEDKLSDKIEPLKASFTELKAKALEKMIPVVEKVVNWFSKFADWCGKLKDKIMEIKDTELGKFLEKIVEIFSGFAWQQVVTAFETIKLAIEGVVWVVEQLADTFEPVFETINNAIDEAKKTFDEFTKGFEEGLSGVEEFLKPVSDAFEDLKSSLKDLFDVVAQSMGFENLEDAFAGIKEVAGPLGEILGGSVKNAIQNVSAAFIVASGVIQGVIAVVKPLIQLLTGDFEGAMKSFKAIPSELENIAKATEKQMKDLYDSSTEETDKAVHEIEADFSGMKLDTSKIEGVAKTTKKSMDNSQSEVNLGLGSISGLLLGFNPSWKISKPSTTDATNTNTNLLSSLAKSLTGWKPSWKISKPDTKDATSTNTTLLSSLAKSLTGWKPSWKISKPSTTDATSTNTSLLNSLAKALTGWKPSWKVSKPSTTDATSTNTSLLNSLTKSLTGWKPSWKISKPSTTDATSANTSLLSSIKNKLTSFKPSWSISKPSTTNASSANTSLLSSIKNKLTSFRPSWSISKPSTTNATSANTSLLSNIKNKLTSFRPSWSIPKPNTSNATNTSFLSSLSSKLRSFRPSWSIPRPSLPSFRASISWTTTTALGKTFRYPSGISWHGKGGIFTSPTIFNTANAGLHGVGEAGAEAILPLDSFYNHLDSKIDQVVDKDSSIQLGRIYGLLAQMELRLDIDGREFTRTAVAPNSREIDNYNNLRRR